MKKKIVAGALAVLMASSLSLGANAACASPRSSSNSGSCSNNTYSYSSCGASSDSKEYSSCLDMQYNCYYSCGGWVFCYPSGSCTTDTNTSGTTETPSVTPPVAQTDADFSEFASEVLELVNAERAVYGLSALKLSEDVCKVAQAKADDMQNLNYFDHTSPTYGGLSSMLKAFDISYRSAGENIAYGYRTPSAVVTAWMNSAGHRANILSENYTQMGLGYTEGSNYWCQLFIG